MSDSSSPAIGIDLGTTNSCVAIYLNGRAEVLANDVGERTTPSYVGFKDEEILVGKIAKDQAYRNYGNTIFDVKRLIGKKFNNAKLQEDIKYWPFGVINRNGNPEFKIKLRHQEVFYCPEQISAIILEKLKDVASKRVEGKVTKAVITVPAYFNDSQRQATKDAGKLAGLEVLRLLNEPTAAAIAYALDKSSKDCKHALVFDLGGGTFDVSIISFENRHVTVKGIDGDTHLGGDDFDNELVNYLVDDIQEKFSYNIQNNRRAMARLLSACERTKQLLSFQTLAQIELDGLIDGEDYDIELSRAKFEDLNEELFQRTLSIVRTCVDSALLTPSDIDNVVLVGGSTKIPRIRSLLEDFFDGKELSNAVNPDEAVALGAAIQAAHLCNKDSQVVEDFVLEDVVPFSLGVETAGGLMNVLIKRNTLLPATARKTFTTAVEDQTSVNIKIFEGEKLLTKDNNFLGELKVTGIISAPSGVPRIDETFYVDENGILSVTAVERSIGKVLNLSIDLDKGRLSEEEIVSIITKSSESKEQGQKHWKVLNAKNELESYCNKMLRLIKTLKMNFNDSNFIFLRCEEALSYITETKNEKDLRKKLKSMEFECESIVKKYQSAN